MISINEAKEFNHKYRLKRGKEVISLTDAQDRILAEEIKTPFDSPCFDNSAMDGFAVKWSDVKTVTESETATLKIACESEAGNPRNKTLKSGEAVRIDTGTAVPEDTDTVIPVEHCEVDRGQVIIKEALRLENHIRRKGKSEKNRDPLRVEISLLLIENLSDS